MENKNLVHLAKKFSSSMIIYKEKNKKIEKKDRINGKESI